MTPTDGLTDEFLEKAGDAYSRLEWRPDDWRETRSVHDATHAACEAMRALLAPLRIEAEARGRREALTEDVEDAYSDPQTAAYLWNNGERKAAPPER